MGKNKGKIALLYLSRRGNKGKKEYRWTKHLSFLNKCSDAPVKFLVVRPVQAEFIEIQM